MFREGIRLRTHEETNSGTVYVIDDDVDVRNGLVRLLRSGGWNAEPFPTAQDFLNNPTSDGIACILLDVSMPGMSGPELHDQLRARGNHLPVVYLTGQGTVSIGVQAMRRGAFDFLEKPVDAIALLSVVAAAIAHRKRARLEEARLSEIRGRISQLSPREREVMGSVIKGRLNKQIASDLGIGVKTVKVHRGRVMRKMAVRSVAQLVHLCDELGVHEPDSAAS